ncbi:MAG: hypothetical protein PF542_00810 [Nanoarchaeota archaeon]|nr:hypothetical protein [Nanoarchaeota archaeon]
MNLRGLILGIAIFVLTLFVTSYGVNTVYPSVAYDDFCSNTYWEVAEMNESVCFDNGGKWNDYGATPVKVDTIERPLETGYCDKDYLCREAYELANERQAMNVFLIAVPLGILILLGGFYFFTLETVGVGLMAGGVGTMLRGISSYWQYSSDAVRFLVSLAGLIVVIYFSYRFGNKIENKKSVGKKVVKKKPKVKKK